MLTHRACCVMLNPQSGKTPQQPLRHLSNDSKSPHHAPLRTRSNSLVIAHKHLNVSRLSQKRTPCPSPTVPLSSLSRVVPRSHLGRSHDRVRSPSRPSQAPHSHIHHTTYSTFEKIHPHLSNAYLKLCTLSNLLNHHTYRPCTNPATSRCSHHSAVTQPRHVRIVVSTLLKIESSI